MISYHVVPTLEIHIIVMINTSRTTRIRIKRSYYKPQSDRALHSSIGHEFGVENKLTSRKFKRAATGTSLRFTMASNDVLPFDLWVNIAAYSSVQSILNLRNVCALICWGPHQRLNTIL